MILSHIPTKEGNTTKKAQIGPKLRKGQKAPEKGENKQHHHKKIPLAQQKLERERSQRALRRGGWNKEMNLDEVWGEWQIVLKKQRCAWRI